MYKELSPHCANRLTSGGQIVNVSTVSKEGVPDVMTAAWNTPFAADEVLVVLDLPHTTTKNILETGKFVVSIPDETKIREINKVGSRHGAETGDKFAWAGITPVETPRLGIRAMPDALAYIECELTDPEVAAKTGVCIGKAVAVRVKEELWDDGRSSCEEGFRRTLHYVTENTYYVGGRILKVPKNHTTM